MHLINFSNLIQLPTSNQNSISIASTSAAASGCSTAFRGSYFRRKNMRRWTPLVITSLVVHSLSLAVNADSGEVEDESTFTYEMGSKMGPENWGKLNPNWTICGHGELQSPIDVKSDRVVVTDKVGALRRRYKAAPAVIKNRGHDISVVWEGDAGGVLINGTRYVLRQCHWHTPSEHTVNGRRYNMEIHMVHNNSVGHLSVIGIMYKLGRPDTFLTKLLGKMKKLNDKGWVDPWDIKFGSRKYYRYLGSLTVPPCTEGVVWSILNKVRTVSREQIRALRQAVRDGFEDNARPTQKSDLDVYMYRPRT